MENLRKEYVGALQQSFDRLRTFAFGILRPEIGAVGEQTYDSSSTLTLENLGKEYSGVIAGFRNTVRGYAQAAMAHTGPVAPMVEPLTAAQTGAATTATGAAETAAPGHQAQVSSRYGLSSGYADAPRVGLDADFLTEIDIRR